jgi:Spy/CpxP family protein refolding chaperone
MKRNAKLVGVLAVAAALLCAPAAYAFFPDDPESAEEGRGGRGNGGHKEGKGEFYKELNLTDQQRQQIEANRARTKEASKALRETMKAKRDDLKAELDKPTVDMNRVNAITADIKALTGRMIDQKVANILSLKSILTPEQFQKMTARMDAMKGGWRGHGGRSDKGDKGGKHEPKK